VAEESKLILSPSGQSANDELKATESAHNSLLTEHRELLVEHQALMKEMAVVKGDRDAWRKKYEALAVSNKEMDDAHKALMAEHAALLKALPKGMKKAEPYVYSEGECQPVPKNGVCQLCGWGAALDNPKHLEPHPIS
jgi:hypothetical protein